VTRQAVEVKRAELIARGSLLRLKRKCGKQNCRCAEGDLHQSWAISYNVGGRTKMLIVPEEELATARQATIRYRQAVEELKARGLAGIEQMRRTWSAKKRGR